MKTILFILLTVITFGCGTQRSDNKNSSDTRTGMSEDDLLKRKKIIGKYKVISTGRPIDSTLINTEFEFSLKYYYTFSKIRNIVEQYELDSNKIIIRYKRGSNQQYVEEKIVYQIINDNELVDRETEIKYQQY